MQYIMLPKQEAHMSYMNSKNFGKAVVFIYKNINKPLKLEEIATEVGISISSLKRLFEEAINQTPGNFIRRLRMEFAFRSLQSKDDSILETALASGFDDHSAFSRQFKETFGYPPSEARKKLNIVSELESIVLEEPDIIEIENLTIQSVTQVGIYFESAPKAWEILRKNLNEEELSDDFSGVFIGIGHDNPHDSAIKVDETRYTAGVALLDRDLKIDRTTIAPGRYARFRHFGKPANLGLAYHYIYGQWQQNSGFKINEKIPAFCAHDTIKSGMIERKIFIHVPIF